MSIIVQHTWTCTECGKSESKSQALLSQFAAEIGWCPLPLGWNWIGDHLVCNQHRIDISKFPKESP